MIPRKILKKIRQIEIRTSRIVTETLAGLSFSSLLLVCGCSTPPEPPAIAPTAELPAEVAMNKEAGRGILLFVRIRLEGGEEIPCALDTGAATSHLSRDVEHKLGTRLGTRRFSTLDRDVVTEHLYKAPKLYLGDVQLVTGDRIGAAGNTMAVLGMDCLRHYCIQLDFQAGKIRFLDPESLPVGLGDPFQLTDSRYATIRHTELFDQTESELLIDTGCPFDAYLKPGRFRRQFEKRQGKTIPMLKDGVLHQVSPGLAQFSECDWNGGHYTNLVVGKGPNLIGLRFLARHRVTFNFPKGVMYLKQTNVGPL